METVRSQLFELSSDHHFAVPAYCFMPDHLHTLVEGRTDSADLPKFARQFKQVSGYRFVQCHGCRLWQVGYYDHILCSGEASLRVAKYIVENPVRANLVKVYDEYPYSGSDTYSLTELAEAVAWDPVWVEPVAQG